MEIKRDPANNHRNIRINANETCEYCKWSIDKNSNTILKLICTNPNVHRRNNETPTNGICELWEE